MTINFSAGPGVLPTSVLQKVQSEFLNFNNSGISIVEMSHRSNDFISICSDAEKDLRLLLNIPDNYKVLFTQGGASSQFSAICYNLVADLSNPIDYVITGQWSAKAQKEAARLGCTTNIVYSNKSGPLELKNLKFSKNSSFIYYCDNETVDGFELPVEFIDSLPGTVVCDMSSNLLSRQFDIKKYGVVFGGAQKNIGPAGLTIVIVRDDLLLFDNCPLKGPLMMDYKTLSDNASMYNTPPCFSIYVSGLVFKHLLNLGPRVTEDLNFKKSQLLYLSIETMNDKYVCPVDRNFRSRMNVVFRVLKNGVPDENAEKRFCKEAEVQGMICLAGHRSVGGLRASLYNALSLENVNTLVTFMKKFNP